MMPSMHPKKLEPDASHMSPAEFIQTRNELLQALFDKAFISHENHIEKERYDYIYVQFWTFKEYDDSAKDAMEDTALSDKIAYLEDVKGKSVDIRRVKAIRSELRGIFKQISNNLARAIEPTWTRYDTFFQDAVYKHLRVKYPEFMLCEDNWKARSFMSNWYSNWTKNLKKAAKLGAPETEKGKGRATAKVIPAKRRIDDTVTASTSKRRLDHNSTSHEDESFSDIIIDVVPPQIQIISPLNLKAVNLPIISTPISAIADNDDDNSDLTAATSFNSLPAFEGSKITKEIDITTDADSITDTSPVNPIPPLMTDSRPPSASTPLGDSDINGNLTSQDISLSFEAAHSLLTQNLLPQADTVTSGIACQPQEPKIAGIHSNEDSNENMPATATAASAKGKKNKGEHKKRVNLKSTTAENLFAIDFQKTHDGKGTIDQFKAAWKTLSAPDKLRYQEQSVTLAAEVCKLVRHMIRLTISTLVQKKTGRKLK
ncbi:hypothetical protein JOM56_005173 [Amanita muscaria]